MTVRKWLDSAHSKRGLFIRLFPMWRWIWKVLVRVTTAPGLPGLIVLVHDYCSSMTINHVLFTFNSALCRSYIWCYRLSFSTTRVEKTNHPQMERDSSVIRWEWSHNQKVFPWERSVGIIVGTWATLSRKILRGRRAFYDHWWIQAGSQNSWSWEIK